MHWRQMDYPLQKRIVFFNEFVGDRNLPLVIFHNHFIGQSGGIAIFFVNDPKERDTLLNQKHLDSWHIEVQPLIFSYGPSAFDEQTAFTLKAYRGMDWENLQKEKHPSYGDPRLEAETAEEG